VLVLLLVLVLVEVRTLVDETVNQFGRLDVAVNNAGTEGKPGPLTDQTAASYAATFDEPEIKFYEHSNHVG
jgi:NAD(P)-dependent dehydrogenase (short-subunit alcohol dehydrogenase family)